MRHALILLCVLAAAAFVGVAWRQVEAQPRPATKTLADFGVVGNGEADDSEALQEAVDALGSIRLPRGVYRLTKPVTFTLTGAGGITGDGDATLKMDGPGPALRFVGTHGGTADPKTMKPDTWSQFSPRVRGIDILGNHAEADGI